MMKKLKIKGLLIVVLILLSSVMGEVLGQDNAPVLLEVPGQTIGLGGDFESIDLSSYLESGVGSEIDWSYTFLKQEQVDELPTWSVNAASYQYSMNLIVKVSSRNTNAMGDTHILAAFSGQEVRGFTSAILIGETWTYFLTAYSNQESESISFKFYDSEQKLILPVDQQIDFQVNAVLGGALTPLSFQASFVLASISESGLVQLTIPDASLIFTDSISFIVTHKTNSALADTTKTTFSIKDDYSPVLSAIESQEVSFGEEFVSFDLDDHITLEDNDEIAITVSGATELTVGIDAERIVSITKPTSDWSGSETLTFKITDQTENAFFNTKTAVYTVKPEDHAPVLLSIPDQKTGVGRVLNNFDISTYLVEVDGDEIEWSYSFVSAANQGVPSWQVDASSYEFSMNLTTSVNSLGVIANNGTHQLAAYVGDELRGVTSAIEVGTQWVFFLTIYGSQTGEQVILKFYDADHDRVVPIKQTYTFEPNGVLGDPITPPTLDAGQLLLDISTSGLVNIEIVDSMFVGSEQVVFYATDANTTKKLQAKDTVSFTVIDVAFPNLNDIPNQTIEEGQSFAKINLSEYLIDFAAEDVNWSFSGNDELTVEIVNNEATILMPDDDWFGTEEIAFVSGSKSEPDFQDADLVIFQVNNVNDVPTFTSGSKFSTPIGLVFGVELEAADIDSEELTFTFSDLPTWLSFIIEGKKVMLSGTPVIEEAKNHIFDLTISDGTASITESIEVLVAAEILLPVSSQIINEGETFSALDLNDFIFISGDKEVIVEVSGGAELIADLSSDNLLNIAIPNEDWFGSEAFEIVLKDKNTEEVLDSKSLLYQVDNINDAPKFLREVLDNAVNGKLYQVEVEVMDADQDQLTFTIAGAPSWLTLIQGNNAFTLLGTTELRDVPILFTVIADDKTTTTEQSYILITEAILGIESDQEISIYPNPTTDILNLNFGSLKSSHIELFDYMGKKIYTELMESKSTLNLRNFPSGIYYLTYRRGNTTKSIKVIKK